MRLLKILLAALLLLTTANWAFIYLAPEAATRLILDAERRYAGLERKEIVLPDGLRYVYLEGGGADDQMQREPLLLLHGFGANKDNFVRVARHLTPHYRVIVPDHVGFGESAHPADADYAPQAQAERLHRLAQALGIQRVHLGGSSMGGQIALSYAVRYPAEVASLWLLDPGGIWSAPPSELRSQIARGRNPLLARSTEEFQETFAFVMTDPPFIPRPLLDVMARERIANYTLEQRIFKEISADSIEARIAGLATPTLIVFGSEDRTIHPATADILQHLLPHSAVVMLPGIGHLPMLEQPARCAKDYLKFRTGLPSAPTDLSENKH
mgnify:CR=1 FL=1